jgi:hypothetical protein
LISFFFELWSCFNSSSSCFSQILCDRTKRFGAGIAEAKVQWWRFFNESLRTVVNSCRISWICCSGKLGFLVWGWSSWWILENCWVLILEIRERNWNCVCVSWRNLYGTGTVWLFISWHMASWTNEIRTPGFEPLTNSALLSFALEDLSAISNTWGTDLQLF